MFNLLIVDDSFLRDKICDKLLNKYGDNVINIAKVTDFMSINSDWNDFYDKDIVIVNLKLSKVSATDIIKYIRTNVTNGESNIKIFIYKFSSDKIDLSNISKILNVGIDGFFDIHPDTDIKELYELIDLKLQQCGDSV